MDLESYHLIGFSCELIKVVHPTDGATARSLQTVGFHAHPSDIEIALKLVHLTHDIELRSSAAFKKHTFSEHEHTDFIALFNAHICESHGIIDGLAFICRNNK
jgi:hypothetical protein